MLKFLLFYLLISTSSCEIDDFSMPIYGTAISRAVIDYIVNFYYHKSSTVNMYHSALPENREKTFDVINEILYNVNSLMVQVDSLNDNLISTRKRVSNIFFVDSIESFMLIFEKINHDHFDPQGYYLIVFTKLTGDIAIYDTMLKIFEALWTKYIINSNIIFMPPGNINEAVLYTYYPYSFYYCESVMPIQLNQFRDSKWLKQIDYFPKKLRNFYGCRLRVATFNNPPFMLINEDENGRISVDGLEGILLRVLSQVFNFNVDLFLPKELWGSIYPNKTYSGAIKMIVDSTVNMTLGFFASMPIRDKIMEASYVHYTTKLVWIVPPGKPQTALEKLTNPLDLIVWIMSSSTFIIGFIVIAVVKNSRKVVQKFVFGNKTQSPGMNFINVILGNSLHEVPMRNFSRFLFIIAVVYFFIIRTCYTSGLVKFMQMDTRGRIIMDTAEMIKKNYTFYMNEPALVYISEFPEVLQRTKVLQVSEYNRILMQLITDPYFNGAFLTSTGHLAYRNLKVFPKLFHEFAPVPLYTLNIVIYLRLGSCLTIPFNDFIISLLSSGLIEKWATGLIDRRYLKKPENDELKILNLEQLEGAFQLLIGGLLLGVIAFCAENLKGRKVLKGIRKLQT